MSTSPGPASLVALGGVPSRQLSARAALSANGTGAHALLLDERGLETRSALDLMGRAGDDSPGHDGLVAGAAATPPPSFGGGGSFFGGWFQRGRANERRGRTGGTPRTVPMRIEPKTYFANERTFLSWLHTAVLIGTIGAGLASVHLGGNRMSGGGADGGGKDPQSPPAGSRATGHLASAAAPALVVVHRHEYAVTFPGGADASSVGFGSPFGGDDDASGAVDVSSADATMDANEALRDGAKRAAAAYFERVRAAGHTPFATSVGALDARLDDSEAGHASKAGVSSIPLVIAMTMLCASVLLCAYATYTFVWRGRAISKRSTVPFHDPVGPVVMGSVMIGAMVTLIALSAAQYVQSKG